MWKTILKKQNYQRKYSSVRGLTYIETLVWISVFVMAMSAIVISLLSFYRANSYTIEQAQAVSEARRGIEKSVQMMREISFASDGAYPIVSIAPNQFYFYSDVDTDPLVERIRIFTEETFLKQGLTKASGDPLTYSGSEIVTTISENVRNIEQDVDVFHYFDSTGAEITDSDITEVRFVTIDLVVNVSPDKLPNQLTLRSSATLRNLR
jgi:type II secretory pathway pseudopilin PulG